MAAALHARKVAFIGGGAMGEAIIKGITAAGLLPAERVSVGAHRAERAEYLHKTYGVTGLVDNCEAVREADLVILAIKPQMVDTALTPDVAAALKKDATVLSIMGSVTTARVAGLFPGHAVIRTMPNTPLAVGAGMTAIAPGEGVRAEALEDAETIFGSCGEITVIQEKDIEAVTAVSGCGPGYVYILIDALADAGVMAGLPRATAHDHRRHPCPGEPRGARRHVRCRAGRAGPQRRDKREQVMAERDKILKYFKGSGDEELAARLIDLAERANRSNTFRVTEFLDPHGQNTAKIIAANFADIEFVTDGGFPNAERVKAAFVSDGFHGVPDFNMAAYLIAWDKRYYTLGHRDVLGAFMGMGCRREILGDIVLVPEGAQIVVDKAFCNYLESNLTAIGAANVTVTPLDRSELKAREEKVKTISATVAALRLDAVAAAGYGTSRSRMADEIKSQNVKINW